MGRRHAVATVMGGALIATALGGFGAPSPAAEVAAGQSIGVRAQAPEVTRSPGTVAKVVSKNKALRRVVFVGNNWAGTADVLSTRRLRRLGTINVIPDYQERMQEIALNPYRLAYFLAIRELIGEGNDQFVDDMYSSNDGKLVVISRPSFADVVAISLETKKIVWRFQVAGVRSDHMALSPDGKTVVVSASTGNVVHALRMSDGKEVGRFASGGSPHENVFVDDGSRLIHASIGMVYTPLDDPALDDTKDDRVLQVVNTKTWKIERRYDLRKALDERGLTKVSTAVRPMTLSPDEKQLYFQLSFFHGYVRLDRDSGKITQVRRLPNLVPNIPREQYLLDSAQHGIAMDPAGRKICVAGTMSDYVTVVDARSGRNAGLVRGGLKPYWVTPSFNGKHCLISWAGSDLVSKVSYKTGRITRNATVGDHPQRIRNGFVRKAFVPGLGISVPDIL
ncbi:MAG: serine/threonine protein kinase [Nocardioides sp.]